MINYFTSLTSARRQLSEELHQRFSVMIQHGTMRVEYFAPLKIDSQQPHAQDELYIIISGRGELNRNGEILKCKAGDILFVPAEMMHHFINFTDDFATWVIFYGKDDGEESGEELVSSFT